MRPQPFPLTPALPKSGAMIKTLGLVAMLSGLLIVVTYEFTKPIIAYKRQQAIKQAVFKVIPGTAAWTEFFLSDKGLARAEQAEGKGHKVYVGYDKNGQLLGLALETAAPGYQDIVSILYGYNPYSQCITGFEVLKSTETPGFGDKITTDPRFLANFNCVDGRLNWEGSALVNAIVNVKHGAKTHPWQVEAISGATITSNAIGRMLNASAQAVFPLISRHLNQMQGGYHSASPSSLIPLWERARTETSSDNAKIRPAIRDKR